MQKIFMSACLLGRRVRYDAQALPLSHSLVEQWIARGQVISMCPEVDAGMSIPRAPAEIVKTEGTAALAKSVMVVENKGLDVTAYFIKGAHMALDLCKKHHIKVAVLTENSPSCGSSAIYDGSFSGKKIDGVGVTAALFKDNGIAVFSQHQLDSADRALQRIGGQGQVFKRLGCKV